MLDRIKRFLGLVVDEDEDTQMGAFANLNASILADQKRASAAMVKAIKEAFAKADVSKFGKDR